MCSVPTGRTKQRTGLKGNHSNLDFHSANLSPLCRLSCRLVSESNV